MESGLQVREGGEVVAHPSYQLASLLKVLRTVAGKHSVTITAAASATVCNPSSAL